MRWHITHDLASKFGFEKQTEWKLLQSPQQLHAKIQGLQFRCLRFNFLNQYFTFWRFPETPIDSRRRTFAPPFTFTLNFYTSTVLSLKRVSESIKDATKSENGLEQLAKAKANAEARWRKSKEKNKVENKNDGVAAAAAAADSESTANNPPFAKPRRWDWKWEWRVVREGDDGRANGAAEATDRCLRHHLWAACWDAQGRHCSTGSYWSLSLSLSLLGLFLFAFCWYNTIEFVS